MTESEIRSAIDAKRTSLRGSSFAADPEDFKKLESLKVRLNTSADPLYYTHEHAVAAAKRRNRHAR